MDWCPFSELETEFAPASCESLNLPRIGGIGQTAKLHKEIRGQCSFDEI